MIIFKFVILLSSISLFFCQVFDEFSPFSDSLLNEQYGPDYPDDLSEFEPAYADPFSTDFGTGSVVPVRKDMNSPAYADPFYTDFSTGSVVPVRKDVNSSPARDAAKTRVRVIPETLVTPDSVENGADVEDLQKLEEQCFFKSDLTTVYRVSDFNLFATAAIKSRGYLLRFAVYPVGITSSSDSSIVALLSTQSGVAELFTRKVPEVMFMRDTLKLKVKFAESTSDGSELIAAQALVRNQWSLVTISITGSRLLLEVINSQDSTKSFGQEVSLSFRRSAVTSAFIYGGLLPAANAFIAQLDICAREAIIDDGDNLPTLMPSAPPTPGTTVFVPSPTSVPTSVPTSTTDGDGGGDGGIFDPRGDIGVPPIGGPIFNQGGRMMYEY